ncbi:helix-turn-helix domain-containing protein [Streptomyces sp. NPDC001584]|uniref:helix-turn-helix domain-containing protein n=1 Tax=Streptomyces sp. NPDC001584 TaxID=3154521 RepID=UPI0033314689
MPNGLSEIAVGARPPSRVNASGASSCPLLEPATPPGVQLDQHPTRKGRVGFRMANRSDAAKARHGTWVFTLATAEAPGVDALRAHRLTRKDAWPNFTRFLIAIGTRWGTWGEDIRPSLDRIQEATGIDRSKASRWLHAAVDLGYLSVARQGSRGVATAYRISVPGEKAEKAAQGLSGAPWAPRPAGASGRCPAGIPGPSSEPTPNEARSLCWDDLSFEARDVFFWPPAERQQQWKPEYGSYEAAIKAAVAHNPYLPV